MSEQMKPFRAWIAWHPESSPSDTLSPMRDRNECARLVSHLMHHDEEGPVKSRWRIVEVEVRPVEKEEA